MKIKENLAYCRRKRKLGCREPGELANTNYVTLHYIECGKTSNPQILVIVTLAQFLSISLDEFVNVDLKCKNNIEDKADDT